MSNTDNYSEKEVNQLFPVFLKLQQVRVLLVGAGNVGLEKLTALLGNSPAADIHVVAREVSPAFAAMAGRYAGVTITEGIYLPAYLEDCELVITALNDHSLSEEIAKQAKAKKILVNAADKPELCDFYLGGVVTKGNLKIAISTNGKSPTLAKKLKEFFQKELPDTIDDLLINLNAFRKKLNGSFEEKVRKLNELTKTLVED